MFFFFLLTRTIGVADLALSQQEGEASPSVTLTLLVAKEQVASGLSLACYFLKKKKLSLLRCRRLRKGIEFDACLFLCTVKFYF